MHNEGSKTGKHVHFVDGVPAPQMDIVNQHYLSSCYAKLQFKFQKAPPGWQPSCRSGGGLFLIAGIYLRVSLLWVRRGRC